MAASVKIKIYRNVTPCSVVHGLHIVKGTWIINFQGRVHMWKFGFYVVMAVRVKNPL